MKTTLISLLVAAALGAVGGIKVYKLMNKSGQIVQHSIQNETGTKTTIQYVDKAGKPVVKETIVYKKQVSVSERLPSPRPKNIVGVTGRVDLNGQLKVGALLGRELWPHTYVTGAVLVTPQGSKPELQLGIQLQF
jgi:hypothetical protein